MNLADLTNEMTYEELLRRELTEVAEKLFPGSLPCISDVVDSLIQNGAYELYMCSLANSTNKQMEDVPLCIWERAHYFREASRLVGEITGSLFGKPEVRDPDSLCQGFVPGEAAGDCQTDGHHLCADCRVRDPALISNPESPFYVPPLERRKNKAEW